MRFNQGSKRAFVASLVALGTAAMATPSHATLTVDVRALSITGATASNLTSKAVTLNAQSGGFTVVMGVYADVSNAENAVVGTTPYETLSSFDGSFLNSGSNIGNLSASELAPFNANGASGGTSTDLDGSGGLDLGSNDPSDPAGFYGIRATFVPVGPNSTDDNGASLFTTAPTTTTVGGVTTVEYRVGTVRLVVPANTTGGTATVTFRPRNNASGATYFENSTQVAGPGTDQDGNPVTVYSYTGGVAGSDVASVSGGLPVSITITPAAPSPEPASISLVALAAPALLRRRRANRA